MEGTSTGGYAATLMPRVWLALSTTNPGDKRRRSWHLRIEKKVDTVDGATVE